MSIITLAKFSYENNVLRNVVNSILLGEKQHGCLMLHWQFQGIDLQKSDLEQEEKLAKSV